jgi:NADH-quinone oxidoreductase subunit M
MVFTLANVGLPGTSGFVGEFLSLIGTFRANIPVATLATLGVILSAAYALWLYRKIVFGALKPAVAGIRDIGWREAVIFTPLVVLTILLGVAPKPVLDVSAASVAQLLDRYHTAVKAAEREKPSIRGVRHGEAKADEPGIRKRTLSFDLDSGSALAAHPGMTVVGLAR